MKIKKNKIPNIIYPHILNPLFIILLIIYSLYVLLFGYISKKKENNYIVYYYNNYDYRDRLAQMLGGWISLFYNTIFMNEKRTLAFTRYKTYWLNHYYKKNTILYERKYNELKYRYNKLKN